MKHVLALLTATILVVGAVVFAGDEMKSGDAMAKGGWFDFQNCDFCKPWMAEAGLMEHCKWESKSIATGMINATVVEPAFEAAYEHAHGAMMAEIEKAMAGEKKNMCQRCSAMMTMAMAGAKMENMDIGTTHVMTATSTDPKVIAMAQDIANKDTEEMAKMAPKEMKEGK